MASLLADAATNSNQSCTDVDDLVKMHPACVTLLFAQAPEYQKLTEERATELLCCPKAHPKANSE